MTETLRIKLERQGKLVAVLAQEIRREHGPTIATPIAGALNSMLSTAVAALAILDDTSVEYPRSIPTGMGGHEPPEDVYTPEGLALYRAQHRMRLVPDPVVSREGGSDD